MRPKSCLGLIQGRVSLCPAPCPLAAQTLVPELWEVSAPSTPVEEGWVGSDLSSNPGLFLFPLASLSVLLWLGALGGWGL